MRVERKKKIIKILVPFFIIMSIIATSIYNIALAEQAQNIKMTIVKKPNIDVILSKGKTAVDLLNFETDLKNALEQEGVNPERAKIQAIVAEDVESFSNFSWEQDIDSAIGNIRIENNGADVTMVGNTTLAGKNALWIIPTFDQEQTFNFNYSINFGDSFNAAGMLLRVAKDEHSGYLTGYLLSFNKPGASYANASGGSNGALWKFLYDGNNRTTMNIGLVKQLNIAVSGNLTVNATSTEITVSGGGLTEEVVCAIDSESVTGSGYGFFSDHYSHGCDLIGNFAIRNLNLQTRSVKEFRNVLNEPDWGKNTIRTVVDVIDETREISESDGELATVVTRLLNEDVHYIGWGTTENQVELQKILQNNSGRGIYFDNTDYNNAIVGTARYIKSLLQEADKDTTTIIADEAIEVQIDPQELRKNTIDADYLYGKWLSKHDESYFENTRGQNPYAGVYTDEVLTNFKKTGKYNLFYAGEELTIGDIYSHRRPVAQFEASLSGNDLTLTSTSYDLDLESNNNGIAEEKWQYKKMTDSTYTDGKLNKVENNQEYVVKLIVKDHQGEWSYAATKHISTNEDEKPVAEFNIKESEISIYNNLQIQNTSYDPTLKELQSYEWKVIKTKLGTTNENNGTENVNRNNVSLGASDTNIGTLGEIYTGTEPIVNFSEYGTGTYKIQLKVTNEEGVESDPFSRTVTITEDVTPPEFYANPTALFTMNDTIDVNLKFTDEGSGFKQYKYAITRNHEVVETWSDNIQKAMDKITITDKDMDVYIHIIAEDNVGNLSQERIIGPYQISDIAFDLEIHMTDKGNEGIGLGNAQFSLVHPKENEPNERILLYGRTNEDGICHIGGKSLGAGTFEYILYETEAPIGYESTGLTVLKITFDEEGKIVSAESKYNDDVEIDNITDNKIILNVGALKNQQNLLNPYNLKVTVEDKDDNTVKVANSSYKIVSSAESGETKGIAGTTDRNGIINIKNQLSGNGEITIELTNTQAQGYIKQEPITVVLQRDEDTGDITFIQWKSTPDIDVDIMGDDVEVTLKAQRKAEKNKIAVKIGEKDGDKGNISGLKVKLTELETDLAIEATTDENGIAEFEIPAYNRSTHNYKIDVLNIPSEYKNIGTINIETKFDNYGKLLIAKEKTKITESVIYEEKEEALDIVNKANVKVLLESTNTYDTYQFKIQKEDENDSTKKISGVEYNIEIQSGIIKKTMTKTTNTWGEITLNCTIKPETKVTITEVKPASGYKLNSNPKIININPDTTAGVIATISGESASKYNVSVNKLNKTITFVDKNILKVDDEQKANLTFYIGNEGPFGNVLENLNVKVKDIINDRTYNIKTGPSGIATLKDIPVKNEGTYTFEIEPDSLIPGLTNNQKITVEINFTKTDGKMKADKNFIRTGEKWVKFKDWKFYETDTTYQGDVYLTLTNNATLSGEKILLDIKNIDTINNNSINGGIYDVVVTYSNGAKLHYNNTKLIDGVELAEIYLDYVTNIELVETTPALGYEFNDQNAKVSIVLDEYEMPHVTSTTPTDVKALIKSITNADYSISNVLTVEIPKERKGLAFNVKIVKEIKEISGYRLPGVGFDFTFAGDKKANQITDEKGEILYTKLKGVDKLELLIQETSVPYGYKINNDIQKVVLYRNPETLITQFIPAESTIKDVVVNTEKQEVVVTVKNDLDFKINIEKEDAENPLKKLAGAEFEITSTESVHGVRNVTTDVNGQAPVVYDLVAPNKTVVYTIKEKKSPEGYKKAREFKLQVSFNDSGKISSCEILDVTRNVYDDFLKKEVTITEPCDWAEIVRDKYELIDGKWVLTDVTSDNSELTIRVKDTDKYSFVISKFSTRKQSSINTRPEPITGATFDIKITSNGKTNTYTSITKDGIIKLNNLEGSGEITIEYEETNPAFGYSNSNAKGKIVFNKNEETNDMILDKSKTTTDLKKVSIDNETGEVNVQVANESKFDIGIKTVDALTNEDLNGARYKITSSEDISDTQDTKNDGVAVFDLKTGYTLKTVRYTIQELIAPTGYSKIYQPIKDIIIDVVFDKNGVIQTTNVIQGKDRVIKIQTPRYDGYVPPISGKTTISGTELNLLITNGPQSQYTVKVVKENENNTRIRVPNTEFKIVGINEDGTEQFNHSKITTDSNGEISISGVDVQDEFKIQLQETKNADGYAIDNTQKEYRFTTQENTNGETIVVNTDSNIQVNNIDKIITIELTNKPESIQLAINKADIEDPSLLLAGADFTIKDVETGKTYNLQTLSTGVGCVNLDMKSDGKHEYIITENAAPIGYAKIDPISIKIDFLNNNIIGVTKGAGANDISIAPIQPKYLEITVTDLLDIYTVKVIKENRDNSKIKIPNTQFSIVGTDAEGNNIINLPSATTNSKGEIVISNVNIRNGTEIKLQETMNADGYILDNTEKTIEFTETKSNTGRIIGYQTNAQNTVVQVNNSIKVIEIRVKNEPQNISVAVKKVDNEDNKIMLANAKIQIKDKQTGRIYEAITDSDGIGVFKSGAVDGIPLKPDGTYTYEIIEKQSPNGYESQLSKIMTIEIDYKDNKVIGVREGNNSDIFDVDTFSDKSIEMTLRNKLKSDVEAYTVEVIRVNKNNHTESIPNAKMKIELSNNNPLNPYTITKEDNTNTSGTIYLNKSITGEGQTAIKITESGYVAGYVWDPTDNIVHVDRNSETGKISITSTTGPNILKATVDESTKTVKITIGSIKTGINITGNPNVVSKPFKVSLYARTIDTNQPVAGTYTIEVTPDTVNPGAGWKSSIYMLTNKDTQKVWPHYTSYVSTPPWDGFNQRYVDLSQERGYVKMEGLYGTGLIHINLQQVKLKDGYVPIENQEIVVHRDPMTGQMIVDTEGIATKTTFNQSNNEIIVHLDLTPTFTLHIQKEDIVTGDKLENVEFEVSSNKGQTVEVTTDSGGEAVALVGRSWPNETVEYTIKEKEGKAGYRTLEDVKLKVTFDNGGMVASQSIIKDETESHTFPKIDNSEIYYPLQMYYPRWTYSYSAPYLRVNYGVYKETGNIKVLVKNDDTYRVKIINVDKDNGARIQGTSFQLTQTDGAGNKKVYNATGDLKTDANGEMYINFIKGTDLLTLDYEELYAGDGYKKCSNGQIKIYKDPNNCDITLINATGAKLVNVYNADGVLEIVVENERQLELEIEKVEINNTALKLEGAEFKITSQVIERNGNIVNELAKEEGTITTDIYGLAKINLGKGEPHTKVAYTLDEIVPPAGFSKIGQIRIDVDFDNVGYVSKVTKIHSARATAYKVNKGKIGVVVKNGSTTTNSKGENVIGYDFKIQKTDKMIPNYQVNGTVYKVKVYQNDDPSPVQVKDITTQSNSVLGAIVEQGMATLYDLHLDGNIKIEFTEAKETEGYIRDTNTYTLAFNVVYEQAVDYSITKDIIPVITLDEANTSIDKSKILVDNIEKAVLVNMDNDPVVTIGIRHVSSSTEKILTTKTYRITSMDETLPLALNTYNPVKDKDIIDYLLSTGTTPTILDTTGTTGASGDVYIPVEGTFLGRDYAGKTVIYVIDEVDSTGTANTIGKLVIKYDTNGKVANYYMITDTAILDIDISENYTGKAHVNLIRMVDENVDSDLVLTLEKVDASNTKMRLGGSVFEIIDDAKYDGTVYDDMTVVNLEDHGIEQLNLDYGVEKIKLPKKPQGTYRYIIKETEAPSGYDRYIGNMVLEVKYDDNKQIISSNIVSGNEIVSKKHDKDGITLTIKNNQTSIETSDANPYTLKVIKTDNNNQKIVIPDTMLQITVQNEQGVSPIVIADKTDENGEIALPPINGTGRIDIDINEILPATGRKADTNPKNVQIHRDVTTGNMTLVEANNIDDVNIDTPDEIKIYISNEQEDSLYTLYMQKVDQDGNPILQGGVTFDVKLDNGTQRFSTNGKGELIATNLMLPTNAGRHILQIDEIIAPSGYKKLEKPVIIEMFIDVQNEISIIKDAKVLQGDAIEIKKINDNYLGLDLKNEKEEEKPYVLEIIKVDENNKNIPIQNTQLHVTIENEGIIIEDKTALTDKDGKIVFEGLNVDNSINITVEEMMAAPGRKVDNRIKTATIKRNTITGEFSTENSQNLDCDIQENNVIKVYTTNPEADNLYTVYIQKVDEAGNPITQSQAKFIMGMDGADIIKGTNEKGQIIFEKQMLPSNPGRHIYNITEFEAPEGYKGLTSSIQLEVNVSKIDGVNRITNVIPLSGKGFKIIKTSKNYIGLEITNEKRIENTYDLVIQKVDEEENAIKANNIEFDIRKQNDTTWKSYTTDNNGIIELTNNAIPNSSNIERYVIKETVAPNGYKLNNEEIILEIEFVNQGGTKIVKNAGIVQGNSVVKLDVKDGIVQINIKNEKQQQEQDDPLYLRSDKYVIDNLYIDRISPKTTLTQFIQNCETNGVLEVFDKNGRKLEANDYVGTGMLVRATKGSEKIEKTSAVIGDLTGNGKIGLTDLSRLESLILDLITVDNEFKLAADIGYNKKIDLTDLARCESYILDLIDL